MIRSIKQASVAKNYNSTIKWWHLATNSHVLLLFIFVYKILVSQSAKQWKNNNMKTKHGTHSSESNLSSVTLTLILLTWWIRWAPNNASKWQMGFNSAFKRLITLIQYSQHNNYIWKSISNTLFTPFPAYTYYQIPLSKFFIYQLMHKSFALKEILKSTLKMLWHLEIW